MEILFEDNHLIAINKRAGEIVQGDKTGDEAMSESVKKFIKEKYNKPGNVFCGVIHRIDRPVSGVVLFAKTSKMLERMNELFRSKEVKKTYWAVVKNKPLKNEDVLTHYLIKDELKNKSRAYTQPKGKSLKCELHYKVIASSDNYFLLEINPFTGRHHQIRVQLSEIGSPIKGDLKYGSERSNADGSIHLHARKVEFIHPVKNELVIITAEPPSEPLWNYFNNTRNNG
jgi:23S rRNA pseudouridine1911/1915/1917 synthase